MKSKLREKWQPSERCYSLLENKGIPREWVGHQLGEFKLYWIDAGLKKSSWDMTFSNWVKKNWEQVDKRRMYHEKTQPTITGKLTGWSGSPKPTVVPAKPKKEMTRDERTAIADMLAGLVK